MLVHRALVFLLSLLMALPPTTMANILDDNLAKARFEKEMANLDRLASFALDLERATNRESYELDAILEKTDYEAADIISFVKKAINYEPYAGTLRGARGTLISKAGNSLDQAILLAKLLRDAGYDARIARTSLDDSEAQEILGKLKRDSEPEWSIGDVDAIIDAFQDIGLIKPIAPTERKLLTASINDAPGPKSWAEYPRIEETSSFILKIMARNGIQLEPDDVSKDLIKEAKEYFWVEFRELDAGNWTGIHPVFEGELPFPEPSRTEVFAESIPGNLQHRIRFQAFIERFKGGALEIIPIMSPWERPVANLIGQPVTFANIADTMLTGTPSFNLDQLASGASYFAPGFMGNLAPGAQFFDLNGNLIDPMVVNASSAGFVKQIGRAFGDATGTLGNKESLPVLTAQWLEFTLIEPGGVEQKFKRTTFDFIGPAARKGNSSAIRADTLSREQVRTVLKRHTFMPHAGKVSSAFATAYGARRLLDSRPAVEAALRQQLGQPAQSSIQSGSIEGLSADWLGHLSLFTRFDLADQLSEAHRVYRHKPALVIQSEGLATEGTEASIDIVTNPHRSLRIDGTIPRHDPEMLIQAGIWETLQEGKLLPKGDRILNTWTAFDDARKHDINPVVVSTQKQLDELSLSNDSKVAISRDLENGFIAILPSAERSALSTGWWRVDPLSGSTLGQIGDGRGSELVGYIALAITLGFVAYGAVGCASAESEPGWTTATSCCMASNAYFATAGLVLGIAVGPSLPIWVAVGASVGADVYYGFVAGPVATEVCTATMKFIEK